MVWTGLTQSMGGLNKTKGGIREFTLSVFKLELQFSPAFGLGLTVELMPLAVQGFRLSY